MGTLPDDSGTARNAGSNAPRFEALSSFLARAPVITAG